MKYRMIKKRRRQALTDYRKRIALLQGGMPRMVVRKSNRGIMAQIINFEPTGDKVMASVNSSQLRQFGWEPRSNTPTSYLTGLMLARVAKKANITQGLVLDNGLYKPGKASVIFAAAKGAADGGLKLAQNIEFDTKRLSGEHIAGYANAIKGDSAKYTKQFSGYGEKNFDVSKINALFEAAKKKIMSE